MSSSASALVPALQLSHAEGERIWRHWRAAVKLNDLDAASLAVLPLLAGRLPSWLADDPDRERILGICKRGWARNQLLFQQLVAAWAELAAAGAGPIAVAGDAAWSLLYLEERAVRPIGSLAILVDRQDAARAKQALELAGWFFEPAMPEPRGRALDEYAGVWFRSGNEAALFLTWRLRKVSPELAAESEARPVCRILEVQGARLPVVETEELLLDALTREGAVPDWRLDVTLLLRNRDVNWPRLGQLVGDEPLALERLTLLGKEGMPIPPVTVRRKPSGRLARVRADYRRVAWSRGQPDSRLGLARYLLYRAWRAVVLPSPPGEFVTVIDAAQGGASAAAEYRRYQSLFYFLTIRDIRLRYRRTWRGVLWALVQPLLPMLILAAVFSGVIRPELPAGPYWLFVLAGLVPWNFFANAVNYSSLTFVSNFGLLNKVYFPRAILPIASVSAFLLDLLVSSLALILLGWWQGYPPTARLLWLPLLMAAAVVMAAAAGIGAASLNVLDRDLKPLVPFAVQVALYATPVLYPLAMVPAAWRWLAWLNPMAGIVEGFRACLLGTPLDGASAALSAVSLVALAGVAAWLFRRVEADLAERA